MMPKMDGFELARVIRVDANSSHIPLILLTAKASDESRITGLETGVDAYLTKPFNAKKLEVRIAKLIEQRRQLRQRFAAALIAQEAANVSDIAYQYCFADSTNFARAFKAQFGVSPSQYREQQAMGD